MRHEPQVLLVALQCALGHLADPAPIRLAAHDAGLETAALLGHHPGAGHPHYPEHVLGVALQVLLAVVLADAGVGGHEDAAPATVHAAVPGALPGGHAAVAVELCRVLAHVPDRPLLVLGVVVVRALVEPARAVVDPVVQHHTADAVIHLG